MDKFCEKEKRRDYIKFSIINLQFSMNFHLINFQLEH